MTERENAGSGRRGLVTRPDQAQPTEYPPALPEVKIAAIRPVDEALALLVDEAVPFPERAALFVALHRLQLKINRVLRVQKPQLAYRMAQDGIERLGPIRVRWVARKVLWRANEPGAWIDDQIQAAMAELAASRLSAPFIRRIPAHWEVHTVNLAAAIAGKLHAEDYPHGVTTEELQQHAIALFREMKERRWRVEPEREQTIELDEDGA